MQRVSYLPVKPFSTDVDRVNYDYIWKLNFRYSTRHKYVVIGSEPGAVERRLGSKDRPRKTHAYQKRVTRCQPTCVFLHFITLCAFEPPPNRPSTAPEPPPNRLRTAPGPDPLPTQVTAYLWRVLYIHYSLGRISVLLPLLKLN